MTFNPFALFLCLGEVERDLGGAPLELAALLMVLDPQSIGDEWIGVAVDDMVWSRCGI